ncbi:trypsin-like peptidase domain-containing protein [Pigmentiphaga litoralis]|uniref:Serine protease DegQ n=1 Tax=Pigmentiphaga litoralis TaxID=516702 RepID=A0A7Y9IRK8_9BURK|nr:trypsin-like peptidase domain-containing protein [Pigmentiphaga litoralis]NYE24678.1 serine protease DegQ [Pigmentiphaga litoralis]NYE81708.1 serine protease DegQ [Pigmentiphaga litoralis]
MRRLWLIFAQTTTVCLAILFIVATLRPEWLPRSGGPNGAMVVPFFEAAPPATAPAAAATSSYALATRKAAPAVVNIFTSKDAPQSNSHPFADDPVFRRFFGDEFNPRRQQTSSLGSGVIVSPEGYVLTNNHVIEAADEIEVALADGRKGKAMLVGADPETDLAVLKLTLPTLPAVTFGRAEDLSVGDVVLAIGNPFGVGQTTTMGIVSALGRTHLGINTFENFIQTDAAINPGNSGGALIDASGNLVGINTAIYSRSGGSLGIGFAIPVSTARQVMEQLITSGSVTRGYIGVEPQDLTSELADAFKLSRREGVIIAGVVRGGPAAKAGIRTGDIVVSVDDKGITDTTTMLNAIAALAPGTKVKIKLVRGGQEFDSVVTVATRPQPRREPQTP